MPTDTDHGAVTESFDVKVYVDTFIAGDPVHLLVGEESGTPGFRWRSFDDYLASGQMDPNWPGWAGPPPQRVTPISTPGADDDPPDGPENGPYFFDAPSPGANRIPMPAVGQLCQTEVWQEIWFDRTRTGTFALAVPQGGIFQGYGF